ncbi:MAG: heavy metal translocating P-type ATPase [bacterium]
MEHIKNKYHDHHKMMVDDFFKRFWISLLFSLPVILLSQTFQDILFLKIYFTGSEYISFFCVTIVFIYGAKPFFSGLIGELKKLQPGMMTLIALALTVAYFYSFFVFWGFVEGKIFFWEVVSLIDIMLLGHFIEMKSVLSASQSVEKLISLLPAVVHLYISENDIQEIELKNLKMDQKVLVKPGETIPADGIVLDGVSEVNESFLTGESKPIKKQIKDKVVGGSLNINGSLIILVKGTGSDSYLSKVIDLVRTASESKTYVQSLADNVAGWLAFIAIFIGTITFFTWFTLGKNLSFSLERMVTVMVITCPHALGLAIPLVVAVITTLAAKNGFLIRNRVVFEKSRLIDTVVFDKTGTLTKGSFEVYKIISLSSWSLDKILMNAASLEVSSEHSIANAIVNKAKKENLRLEKAIDFKAIPGKGVIGKIEQEIFVGSIDGLKDVYKNIKVSDKELVKKYEQEGNSVILVSSKDGLKGIVLLSDVIRDESKIACDLLKKQGIRLVMLTGDNQTVAQNVAKQLGIDEFFAKVLPDQKAEKIKALQQKGYVVAMVGDGINDAPALAQANVGIAIGAGTEIAAQTADIILVKNDPRNIVDILNLSKLNYKKMFQNLVWATGYNLIAIPLAAGVLYNYKIVLSPAVGAIIMSLSTVIVALNAKFISFKHS